ncbi:MAG TPA: hypothetical protein VKR22_13780 [Acidimicrobiales bacterium]|nr:hypothetical protein [Acidimicrobiales bacterium]
MSRGERDPWAARLPRPTTTPRPSAQVDVIVVPARREPDAPTMVASRRASPTVGIAAVGAGAVIASAFIGSAIFYVPFVVLGLLTFSIERQRRVFRRRDARHRALTSSGPIAPVRRGARPGNRARRPPSSRPSRPRPPPQNRGRAPW